MRSILRLPKKTKKLLRKISIWSGVTILIPALAVLAFNLYFSGKIFPGISIASVDVGGLTPDEATSLLAQKINYPQTFKLNYQNQNYNLDSKAINLSYNYSVSAMNAYSLTRTNPILEDLFIRMKLLIEPRNLNLDAAFDEGKIQKFVSVVAGQISVNPVAPSASLSHGVVSVNKGSPGTELDQNQLTETIKNQIYQGKNDIIEIQTQKIDQTLSDSEAYDLKTRAEKFIGKSLTLNFEFNSFGIKDTDILSLLGPRGGYDDQELMQFLDKIVTQVNRDPQNPKFLFDNGRVTEFQPALDGVSVKEDELARNVAGSLTQLENGTDKNITIGVPATRTPPEVSTDQVNNLGIKELIGRGTSTFYHSIPSRVHNIVLAASRINGTLVKPGDTFSFNDTLGDVSQFTGYQQAYIISEGKTILGDGGGVCQVSTTLFRALLNAGLPITDRTAHAYRVGYYEQDSPPGFDATVYGPSPDLKFRNDTPGYILIEATPDAKHYSLVFELYGTKDGRVASVTKPVISNVTPALPTVYQDDPTLPAGTLKQTDFSAAGAKVTFNYKVVRDGQTLINKNFVSNYQPWAAVYLRGTGPAI